MPVDNLEFFKHPVGYHKDMCERVSEMLVRANPKLSTNVKVMTNGNWVMLESFNACKEISNSKFKNVNVPHNSEYNTDISKFWYNTNASHAYAVLQEYDNTTVKESYDQEYETFYWSGCEYIDSLEYDESYGILAPLWLDDVLPEKFVVFRISDPSYWNFIKQTGKPRELDFITDILDKCEIIKTFDLTENSKIGSYIRRYYNQPDFPESPIKLDENYISFNGISYDTGNFASVKEHYEDRFWKHDDGVLEFDEYITSGFERNKIIVANIMNLEFLFDDPKAREYEFARYFGLYCCVLKDGTFMVEKQNLYEKGNTYDFNITDFGAYHDRACIAHNQLGVNIPASNIQPYNYAKSYTIDFAPEFNLVKSVNGLFCIEDINGQLHSISRTQDSNNTDTFRLCETDIDLKLFNGVVEAGVSACLYEGNTTKSSVSCKILNNIPQYTQLHIKQGNNSIGELTSVQTDYNNPDNTLYPGECENEMFCGNGKPVEIAKSIAASFNATFDIGIRAYYSDCWVHFVSMNSSPAYNNYSIEIDQIGSDCVEFSNDGHFFGSNQWDHVKCKEHDVKSFKVGNWLPSRSNNGISKIIAIVTDFDTAKITGDLMEFPDGVYYDILLDSGGVMVSRTNQIKIYKDFKPTFGRLSFFPVKDIEMSTYHDVTKYGDATELEYEINNVLNQSISLNSNSVAVTQDGRTTITIQDPYAGNFDINIIFNGDENTSISSLYYLINQTENGYEIVLNPVIYNTHYTNPPSTLTTSDFAFDTLSTTLNVPELTYLKSEYDRCYENLNPREMTKSKTQPWICNWVLKNGVDVREKPYRLNNNPVFGQYSFSPNGVSYIPNPVFYNQEWMYIMDKPMTRVFDTNTNNDFKYTDQRKIWSYIGCCINGIDEFEDNLRSTTQNWFDVYFKRDHIKLHDVSNNKKIYYSTPDYKCKYSLLHNGNDNVNAETFFRGAKIEFIMKSDWDEEINNNLDNIKIKYGKDLNGYKFSAVCVPVEISDGSPGCNTKFKVIRNDKFKTITFICYVVSKYTDSVGLLFKFSEPNKMELDEIRRYLLYNYAKDEKTNHTKKPVSVKGPGIVNISSSSNNRIKITGMHTSFLTDFETYNPNDTYYQTPGMGTAQQYKKEILVIYNEDSFAEQPQFTHALALTIDRVDSDTEMWGTIINTFEQGSIYGDIQNVLGSNMHTHYSNMPQHNNLGYHIINCDYNQFAKNLENSVFGNIFNVVNHNQQNQLIYELVNKDGSIVSSENGKYPYALRFIEPMNNAKYEYMSLIYDGEYVTWGIAPSHAAPMYRHTGLFTPLRNDVLYYTDPYIETLCDKDLGNLTEDEMKKLTMLDDARHMNTCFDMNVSDFGVIHDMAFHRTNENNSNVFKLTDDRKPIYPVSNRFAIGKRDVQTFNSSWDPWYFTRTLSNTLEVDCHGTLSMKENKSFFGSKCLSVPDEFIFDIFTFNEYDKDKIQEEDVLYTVNNSNIEMIVNIENILTKKLCADLKQLFSEYIATEYSYGDTTTIMDDVKDYIKKNLLKLYHVSDIKLWIKSESASSEPYIDWSGMEFDAEQKLLNKLKESRVMGITPIMGNVFNKKLVMNTRTGTKYTIGLKIRVGKK